MKPPPFEYHAPRTLEEVVSLLSTLENSRLLAGGQSLMAMMNMRFASPDHLIDLNGVAELSSIRCSATHLEMGAMTRQRDIEFSAEIKAKLPIIHEAILHVGHRQTRNRGTIGGSLCHLDASAELVTICSLLEARLTLVGANGAREVDFAEFPQGYLTTAVQPDECLVRISIPLWPSSHGSSFVEVARRHGDFAIVSAAAMLELNDDSIVERAAIVLGGVDYAPVRLHELEQHLAGRRIDDDLRSGLGAAFDALEPISDVHASSAYRKRLAETLTRRALQTAAQRAKDPQRVAH